jgi:putative ABC transport system ATP-binding protein
MIEIKGVAYTYKGRPTLTFPDIEIGKGSQYLLLGESGSGKTTLLHLMSGLLKSQQGSIKIAGTEITALSEASLDYFRGKNIGFVFQRNHLISALSVSDNLRLARYLSKKGSPQQHIDSILTELGLAPFAKSNSLHLSQGQQQRVAIARALVHEPEIIFADEPTSSLDDSHCEKVINLLRNLATEKGCTLVVATHDHRLKNVIQNQIVLG